MASTMTLPSDFVAPFVADWDPSKPGLIHEYPWEIPAASIAIYILMVFCLPPLIGQPWSVNFLLKVWNLLLSVGSLAIIVVWIPPLLLFWRDNGFEGLLCDPEQKLNQMGSVTSYCCYLFALSKVAELLDTVFLVVRKKPVIFLHWYHHASVLAYSWGVVGAMSPISNIFGCINGFIHTLMYWYYFRAACGAPPKWGRYLTLMQITQMVLGIATTAGWWYFHSTVGCPLHETSHEHLLWASVGMYTSYLVLFTQFYISKHGKSKSAKKKSQ